MKKHITWVILGATSIIAKEFAHLVAKKGHPLLLVARDAHELEIMANDLILRYQINCETLEIDFSQDSTTCLNYFKHYPKDIALFIAFSDMTINHELTQAHIERLIQVNILNTTQLIHTYIQKKQKKHQLIFLSSVAACIGRAKNSLYGGSKAAVECYLEGLQQTATASTDISIIRLGFIDTVQTFGKPGIFYASPPKACAKACLNAITKKKRRIYHPFFWRYIMAIITHLPFALFKKLT